MAYTRVISLRSLVEAAASDRTTQRASGNVTKFEQLFTPENLRALEEEHRGVFAFLAFHPGLDSSITEYVRLGTLASDSGGETLVLFTLDSDARWPKMIGPNTFREWINIRDDIHPSYEVTRLLFGPSSPPPLPGILFIEKFTSVTEPVFVSLAGLDSFRDVAQTCRNVFSLATGSLRRAQEGRCRDFVSDFVVALANSQYQYTRGGKTSVREWLIKGFDLLKTHGRDIVSVVSLS